MDAQYMSARRMDIDRTVMRFVWPVAALAVAAGLFYSSSLPGDISGGASMNIVERAQEWLPFLQPISTDTLHFILRKGAHFISFLALAFCTAHALKYYMRWRYLLPAAWGIASLYGVADEIHQYFIPDRVFLFMDIGINAAGAALGVVIVWLYLKYGTRHSIEGNTSSACIHNTEE